MAKMGTLLITSDMDISEAKIVLERLKSAYFDDGKNWDYLEYFIFESLDNAKLLDCQYFEKACLLDNISTFGLKVCVNYHKNTPEKAVD